MPARVKTMVPSGAHVAPRPGGPGVMRTGAPPVTDIFLSCPPAMKPTQRLSGENMGIEADSVSGIGCPSRESIERR